MPQELTEFIQQLYNALAVSGIYMLVALGITLVYGLTRLVNFAHGQMLTLGAFISFSLVDHGFPFIPAVLITMVGVGLMSEVLDVGLFRRTLNNPLNGFVISLGLIIALEAIFVLQWKTDLYHIDPPVSGVWHVGDITMDKPRAVLFATTVVTCALLFAFLEFTKAGRGIRALAEDATTARLMGVPVGPYISITFMMGSAIAALAGGLLAATFPFDAFSGFDYVLKGFAVAIIGGLGNVRGAIVAALILAFAETIGAAYFDLGWAPAFGLGATALIILFRPRGLFRGSASGGPSHFSMGAMEGQVHKLEAALHSLNTSGQKVAWWWKHDVAGKVTFAAVAVLMIVLPMILPTARSLSVATDMLILVGAAYAFWFPFRYAGIFSIAPAAMMGVGAYTAAYTGTHWDFSFWLQVPAALLVSAFVAAIIGGIALRASASYFLILTLVLSQLTVLVFNNWKEVTKGSFGIIRPGPPTDLGPLHFNTGESLYYLSLAFLGAIMLVIWVIVHRDFGRRLVAIRENEDLAKSLGIAVFRDKLAAFTIFGSLSGASGVLLFYYFRYIEPGTFDILTAIKVQLIVLLGGTGVWLGPIVGGFIFAYLPEVLNLSPLYAQLSYGILLIAVIILAPLGVAGTVKRLYLTVQWRIRQRVPLLHGVWPLKRRAGTADETP